MIWKKLTRSANTTFTASLWFRWRLLNPKSDWGCMAFIAQWKCNHVSSCTCDLTLRLAWRDRLDWITEFFFPFQNWKNKGKLFLAKPMLWSYSIWINIWQIFINITQIWSCYLCLSDVYLISNKIYVYFLFWIILLFYFLTKYLISCFGCYFFPNIYHLNV